MTERIEILEAALDSLPEGFAVLGEQGEVLFWNCAAEAITGHRGSDLVGRPAPPSLMPLLQAPGGANAAEHGDHERGTCGHGAHGHLVHAPHKLGHPVSALVRMLELKDGKGVGVGTAVLFHSAESLDALPLGEVGENDHIETSQTEIKERLESLFEDFSQGGHPFGVLWLVVDQAAGLRRTHGDGACGAMVEKVGKALVRGLRPAETLGQWGRDEFLVICHEPTAAMLAEHAQTLAGLARTADFRWWGDRISITVSIGAAQAEPGEALLSLLERAQAATFAGFHAGGNRITPASGRLSCLPS